MAACLRLAGLHSDGFDAALDSGSRRVEPDGVERRGRARSLEDEFGLGIDRRQTGSPHGCSGPISGHCDAARGGTHVTAGMAGGHSETGRSRRWPKIGSNVHWN